MDADQLKLELAKERARVNRIEGEVRRLRKLLENANRGAERNMRLAKSLTEKNAMLERALEQAVERANLVHEGMASQSQIFQSNFELIQDLVVFRDRNPELAAWLKENK